MNATIRLDFHSYWLCGSGRGEGQGADELPILGSDGLPFVPGKTLRGLLRAAVDILCTADPGAYSCHRAVALFGSPLPSPDGRDGDEAGGGREAKLEQMRFTTQPGTLCVGSATLGLTVREKENWRSWARAELELGGLVLDTLRTRLSSTAMDASGVPSDRALRTVEVVLPMTLYAPIEVPDDDVSLIRDALPLVRALGSWRNRGLGRVTATLEIGRSADA